MKRPQNVIWITTDHMRYDFIAAHNVTKWPYTPNLDRLVSRGISFDRCYANNPLCMPSRCSFMTGCYPQQTGVMYNGQELRPDFRPTVAQCFANGGYRTVQIGKLHFQSHEDHDFDPRPRNAYGFEVFELSEEPGCYEDAYRIWLRGEYPELVDTFTTARPMNPQRHQDARNFRVLDAPWECSHSGWVATQASRYLGAWGRRGTPQFLHLGLYAPHPPLNPTKEMFEPYRDITIPLTINRENSRVPTNLDDMALIEYRRHFAAMVTGVDLAVGKVLDNLEQAGELENTLIIFGSDHGDLCGEHGGVSKNASWYEGIMRLPLVLHWPAVLGTEPKRVEGLVEMVDVLPTLLGLTNLPIPPQMQGNDLSADLIEGKMPKGRDDVYAVHGPGHLMLRNREWKYLRYQRGDTVEELLYTMIDDPDELTDRAKDPKCTAILQNMRDRALTRTIGASCSIQPRRLQF